MSKKRVAILSHGLSTNGIESLLMNIFRNISLDDFEIDVIMALDPGVVPTFEPEANTLGIHTIHISDLDGIQKKIAYFKGLYTVLKKGNYDVVHVNMDMLGGVCLFIAALAGIRKRICHAHTISHKALSPFSLKGLYYTTMRFLIRTFSTVRVGCSELANRYFFGNKSATVIPNGIDLQRYMNPDKILSKSELGFEENVRYVTTVGRIEDVKNPFLIVDIFAELCKIKSDVRFAWIGTGSLKDQVMEYAKKVGVSERMIFLGARTDVHRILPNCEVFLFPSKFEGFGIVLLEAQAAGLSCIASEEIPHDADAGGCTFISNQESAKVWAEKANEFLSSDRPKADTERLMAFDISRITNVIETLYKQ